MRKAIVLFQTRQGYVLPGKFPPVIEDVADDETEIPLPIGPPNVVARIVAFTAPGSEFFFYVPKDVEVEGKVVAQGTCIMDNTTERATFKINDVALLCSVHVSNIAEMNFPAFGD